MRYRLAAGLRCRLRDRFVVADKPADSLPLSRREGHGSYPPTKEGEANGVLTWRMRATDRRVVIPRGQWSLERKKPAVAEGVTPALAQKPGVQPLVTRASNAWPAATWEAHDMPFDGNSSYSTGRLEVGAG